METARAGHLGTMLSVAIVNRAEHEHAWQLVSVETDGGVEVRERICTLCSEVLIEG
jgi:hypothetical protein